MKKKKRVHLIIAWLAVCRLTPFAVLEKNTFTFRGNVPSHSTYSKFILLFHYVADLLAETMDRFLFLFFFFT